MYILLGLLLYLYLSYKTLSIVRARICKGLRCPGIDSKESIAPAFVAWLGPVPVGKVGLSQRPARLEVNSWAQKKVYKFGLRYGH
jgi:hypothetical protein